MATTETAASRRDLRPRAPPNPASSPVKANTKTTKSSGKKEMKASAVQTHNSRGRKSALKKTAPSKGDARSLGAVQSGGEVAKAVAKKMTKAKPSKGAKKDSKKTKAQTTKKDEEDGNDQCEYEIERVVNTKVENGQRLFLVRWKGYKQSANTWEPEEHLANAQYAVDHYKTANKGKFETSELESEESDVETPIVKKPAKTHKAPMAVMVIGQHEEAI